MRRALLLTPLLLAACAGIRPFGGHAPPRSLSYHFSPARDGRLAIEVGFDGEPSGETVLELPSHWANEKGYERAIEHLDAPGATLSSTGAPSLRTIHHRPGGHVTVRYELHQDWSGEPHEYRPWLEPGWFHFIGHAALAHPRWTEDDPVEATLTWSEFPEHFALANSFGSGVSNQSFVRPLGQLLHAVYVGGDFRIHHLEVAGRPVELAVRGTTWPFSDEALAERLQRIVAVERAFWGDDDFPYFLVTLIPMEGERGSSFGGTGLTDSFAMFIAPGGMERAAVDHKLTHLLAHELFHTWNGRRIRREEPEELVYWFSEGFTEYYTRLLTLRAGLITLEEYVADYDEKLMAYAISRARNAPNAEIRAAFWTDDQIEKLPYWRGDQLAHRWNAAIRAASGGGHTLDEVMHDLLHAARTERAVVSPATLDRLVRRYLPGGILEDLRRFVDAGETLVPRPDDLGPCVHLERERFVPFELGFDRAASKAAGHVRGLVPGSAAEQAGLRDGWKLLAWDVEKKATRPARVRVDDGSGPRWIEYLPAGAPVDVPRYALDRAALEADAVRCLAWFGATSAPRPRAQNPP